MKYWIIFSLLISLNFSLSGLPIDNNDSLQIHFTNYYKASIDKVDTIQSQQHFTDFISFLKSLDKKIKGKNKNKEVKYLFKKIHKRYFKKYIENPSFSEIFESGQYNCVTASALYSLVFDYFDIPYQIMELPTHVYVIAYPNDLNIVVESTLPTEGIIEYKKKEIEKYKKELLENKLITEDEMNDEAFFNNFMLTDSIISIKQLNGIQFYNMSIKMIEEEKANKAIEYLEQANLRHRAMYIDQLYGFTLFSMMQDFTFENAESKCLILKHFTHITDGFTDFNYEMIEILREMVEDKPIGKNPVELQKLARCIKNTIEDKGLINDLTNALNISTAVCYHLETQLDSAIHYLSISYNHENKNAFALISQVLLEYLLTFTNPDTVIVKIKHYEKIFTYIKDDIRIQRVGAWGYMKSMYNEFELNEFEKANYLFQEFLKRYPSGGKLNFDHDIIGMGFGAASSYYVREKQYEKAKSKLKEGLKYASTSLELRRKLKMLEETYPSHK